MRLERITHGRHCTCSACAREDWTNPELAPCGMHGSSCPPEYQPWGLAGTYVVTDDMVERAVRSWIVDSESGDFTHSRMRLALEAALNGGER